MWYRVDWNYGDTSPWKTGKVDPVEGEKTEQYISCIGEDGPGVDDGFYRWVQTANELDLTNFNNLYVDFSIESTGYGPVKLRVGNKLLLSSNVITERNTVKFDISDITTGRIKFGNTDGQHYNYNCALIRIYRMWLEGEETKTDQEIIYERITTLEDQTSTINTTLTNKVDKIDGKGLSTEDFTTFYKEKLDNLEAISAKIVNELPETGDKNCYYFVPDNQSEGTNNDFYVTFMYFETLGWKTIGTTKIDLKDYVTFAYLYENNYNKVETNSKLQTKANVSDVYTKEESDTALALKANSADVYNKTEADEKFQTKIQILTQEEYDALVTAGTVDTNTTYLIKSDL